MKKVSVLVIISFAAVGFAIHCGETKACTPGETQDCDCPGGEKGAQSCSDDGTKWEDCECEGGGGGGGGGEDAGSGGEDTGNGGGNECDGKYTGETCADGVCVELKGGEMMCAPECTDYYTDCPSGNCYNIEPHGFFACMDTGIRDVGESCAAVNDCVAGVACLDAGYGLTCWQVCDGANPCDDPATCEDTGLGFDVCMEAEE
ncbi:MAG: hypothetical protein HY897_21710 [Deltaproteobacteria bacterium]|nr:hypothetical protein [Deltaproteobacteria bacterium]